MSFRYRTPIFLSQFVVRKFVSACLAGLLLTSCSSGSHMSDGRGSNFFRLGSEPDEVWDKSRAPAAAYAGHDFTFRKMQPIGAKNEFDFFFKHCEETGDRAHFSKTDYECTGP